MLLQVENLRTSFHTRDGVVRAVDGVSFSLRRGETLGIVGEAGSGKSVACYSLMGLLPMPPARIESGRALFSGTDLLSVSRAVLRSIRGNRITMIFQDPMTALNPFMKIGRQIMEPLLEHGICNRAEASRRATDALASLAIRDADRMMKAYPHELSGGMRQRVMIAMALVTEPDLLIADEPTTALDVSVQAEILQRIKILRSRRAESGGLPISVLFVTHDLAVVAGMCDRVLVMYAGRILESGITDDIYYRPAHPYTRALLRAIPGCSASGKDLYAIPGQPPDPTQEAKGCPFAPRCEHVKDKCRSGEMNLREVAPAHLTACLRVQKGEL